MNSARLISVLLLVPACVQQAHWTWHDAPGAGEAGEDTVVVSPDLILSETPSSELSEEVDSHEPNSPLVSCGVQRTVSCRSGEACFPALSTGQSRCYDIVGAEISCPGEAGADDCASVPLCGQDGAYAAPARRYRLIGDGDAAGVCSEETGLVWQWGLEDGVDWQAARDYCASLVIDGVDDWRVPEVWELLTIVDHGQTPLTIDAAFFQPFLTDSTLWSATELVNDIQQVWAVRFKDGKTYFSARDVPRAVRCVRGGFASDGTSPFDPVEDGAFFDRRTAFTWQESANGNLTWSEALAACEASTLNGRTDWRLPNANEAASLVNYGQYHPASLVPNMPTNWFWTSTTLLLDGKFAIIVNMKDWGETSVVYKSPGSQAHARCVRGPGDWVCNGVSCRSSHSGLEFQRVAADELYSQEDGAALCEDLVLGGHGDWRLPSLSELREAVAGCPSSGAGGLCMATDTCAGNECQNAACDGCAAGGGPSLETCYWDAGLNGPCYWYWSSTAVTNTDIAGWGVDFSTGLVGTVGRSSERAVRCVRTP